MSTPLLEEKYRSCLVSEVLCNRLQYVSPQTGTGTTVYLANNGKDHNFLTIKGREDQVFTQPHCPSEQGMEPHTGPLLTSHSLWLQEDNSPCECQYRGTKSSKSAPHGSEYELYQADFLSLNSKGHKLLNCLA